MKLLKYVVLSIILLMSNHHASAEQVSSNMIIYDDVHGAKKIVAGDYKGAVSDMQKATSENPILLFSNLCVAYALDKQIKLAQDACANALTEAGHLKNYGPTFLERKHAHRTRKLYRERANHNLTMLESVVQLLASDSATLVNAEH